MRRVYSFFLPVLWLWVLMLSLTACGGGSDYVGPTSPTPESGNLSVGSGVSSVSLLPVELKRFEIMGGRKPYSVVSQNSAIVLASVSDATLTLAAVQSHAVPISVIVSDALNNRISLAVTVSNSTGQGQFSFSPERLSLAPGSTASVNLTGGTPPFTAVAANEALVAVSTAGAVLSVTGLQETVEVLVRVTDSQGLSRSLPVTVAASVSSTPNAPLFSNVPAQLILTPQSSRTYTLGGGLPPYSVTTSQAGVLNPSLRGTALVLQTGQVGTAQLSVVDAAGTRLLYTVQVQSSLSPLVLSASEFSDKLGAQMTVWVSGGRPPYTVSTTGSVKAGTVQSDNSIALELTAVGSGSVTVYDANLNKVTMTTSAASTALSNTFGLSPARVTISETLATDATGTAQATVIPLRLTKAEPPVSVFSSHPNLLMPTVSGNFVLVSTPVKDGKALPPCVDGDVTVTITVIDSVGQSASSQVMVLNSGSCSTGTAAIR